MTEILALKPTKGVERQEVDLQGQPMRLFDLGGQQKYRKRYLDAPERYLEGTDLVIYVIDSKDEKRFPEALQYFEDLAKEFRKLDVNPSFALFFHKVDEEYSTDSEALIKLSRSVSLSIADSFLPVCLANNLFSRARTAKISFAWISKSVA